MEDKKSENPQYAQQFNIPGQATVYPTVPGQQQTYSGQPPYAAPSFTGQPQNFPGQAPYSAQGQQYPNIPPGGYQTYTQQPYYPQTSIPMQQAYGGGPSSNFFPDQNPRRGVKHIGTFDRFSDESVRRGFVRKVYSIITLQLMLSTLCIMVFVLVEPVKIFVQTHTIFYFASL